MSSFPPMSKISLQNTKNLNKLSEIDKRKMNLSEPCKTVSNIGSSVPGDFHIGSNYIGDAVPHSLMREYALMQNKKSDPRNTQNKIMAETKYNLNSHNTQQPQKSKDEHMNKLLLKQKQIIEQQNNLIKIQNEILINRMTLGKQNAQPINAGGFTPKINRQNTTPVNVINKQNNNQIYAINRQNTSPVNQYIPNFQQQGKMYRLGKDFCNN